MWKFVMVFGLVGCQSESPTTETTETSTPTVVTNEAVTWYRDVQPLVGEHCQHCHHNEDEFAFPLLDYMVVSAYGPEIMKTLHGRDEPPYYMPPIGSRITDECESPAILDDTRLNDEEIAMMQAWVDAGAPKGDPATAVNYTVLEPDSLTGPDVHTMQISGVSIAEEQEEDLFRCFTLDPGFEEDVWVTAAEVIPDNLDITHHAVIFTDPNGDSEAMAGDDGWYDCFGSAGVSDSAVLYAWAPGSQPTRIPADAGIPMSAGSRLVMQMHYHPTGSAAQDASSLVLEWTNKPTKRSAQVLIIGGALSYQTNSSEWADPPFEIPADAEAHVETYRQDLSFLGGLNLDLRVWGVTPHMHLAGTDILVKLERDEDTGGDQCLSHNDKWDFEWQRSYVYEGEFEDLPSVLPTDTLTIRCTYNNSASNPILMGYAEDNTTATITVGEETYNEMCLVVVGVVW
jgi:hypothetical protein